MSKDTDTSPFSSSTCQLYMAATSLNPVGVYHLCGVGLSWVLRDRDEPNSVEAASKFCRASDFVQVAEWLTPLTKDSEVAGSNPTTVKANLHAQSWWITITSSHHHKETRMKSLSLLPRQMLLHKTRPTLPLYITSVVTGRLLHWNEKIPKRSMRTRRCEQEKGEKTESVDKKS